MCGKCNTKLNNKNLSYTEGCTVVSFVTEDVYGIR